MDATRIDTIAKRFAARRSRRQAVRQGGAGLAAAALATVSLTRSARAQDATPPATDVGEKTMYLFLQSFQSGSLAPVDGAEDRYTLTLDQGLGQTIYFSDRPERLVGASPTPQFLAGLGFPPDNPPNAALVVETAAGATEIAVVELFTPAYDEATHTATYEVAVLEEWENALGVGLTQTPNDLAAFGETFGAAHLFIDDCPPWLSCFGQLSSTAVPTWLGTIPGGPVFCCWSPDNGCKPANCGDNTDYDKICAQAFKTYVDVYAGN